MKVGDLLSVQCRDDVHGCMDATWVSKNKHTRVGRPGFLEVLTPRRCMNVDRGVGTDPLRCHPGGHAAKTPGAEDYAVHTYPFSVFSSGIAVSIRRQCYMAPSFLGQDENRQQQEQSRQGCPPHPLRRLGVVPTWLPTGTEIKFPVTPLRHEDYTNIARALRCAGVSTVVRHDLVAPFLLCWPGGDEAGLFDDPRFLWFIERVEREEITPSCLIDSGGIVVLTHSSSPADVMTSMQDVLMKAEACAALDGNPVYW
jgi:hypothetical protein